LALQRSPNQAIQKDKNLIKEMHIKSLYLRSQLVTFGVCETLFRLHHFKESDTVFVTDDGL